MRRIRSIRNTRKITKAMELVASARLRRAQARIEAMRPYADRMMELMVGTARASTSLRGLALLQRREVRTAAIVPLTGDRGLAGAFNAQVLRRAFALERQLRSEGAEARWLVAGKKGRSTLRFRRYGALPCPAGVGRVRAGRPDDRDAKRVQQRSRPDRQPDARHEPSPPGRDHAGDPRGRRRSGRTHAVTPSAP